MENHLINNVGGLYKTGLIVANCRAVVEAAKRIAELDKRVRLAATLKKGTDVMRLSCEVWKTCQDWVSAGKPVDDEGSPWLNKKDSYAIVKFSLTNCRHHQGIEVKRLQLDEEVQGVAWGYCTGYELG